LELFTVSLPRIHLAPPISHPTF